MFDWGEHARTDYAWWAQRLKRTLELHDEVRIDHFRAFAAYWEVEAGAPTAKSGRWMVGPGVDMFNKLKPALGDAKIVAEDLGVITADVVDGSRVWLRVWRRSPSGRSSDDDASHTRTVVPTATARS